MSSKPAETSETSRWLVEVFFDGDCPLCRREINWLHRMDRRHRVQFTDIASSDFDAEGVGKPMNELMAHIHGRLAGGQWIRGVEVFRQLYSAMGLGWLMAPTRLPGIRHLLDACYELFARNRLRWTGRCRDGACGLKPNSDT